MLLILLLFSVVRETGVRLTTRLAAEIEKVHNSELGKEVSVLLAGN